MKVHRSCCGPNFTGHLETKSPGLSKAIWLQACAISEVEVIVEFGDLRMALLSSLALTTLPGQAAAVGHDLLCGDQVMGLVSNPN